MGVICEIRAGWSERHAILWILGNDSVAWIPAALSVCTAQVNGDGVAFRASTVCWIKHNLALSAAATVIT